MSDYKKIVVNTKNYSVEDMLQGTQPICDTKILEGNEWSFSQDELPATVYYETTSVEVPKVYTFASSEDHVEMSTGRTLREEYMGVLKTMGKEFVSADGNPIQVPSGIEARVINAEIEGQTIKNELANSVPAKILSGSDNFMSLKLLLGNYTRIYVYAECKNINKTAESKFTGRASALDGTGTQFSTGTIDIKEGLAIYTFTFAKPVGNDFQINTDTSKVQSVGVNVWGVFVNQNDISLCKSKLEGGLNSTETIILNNSQQYPIYEPTIQGKTRILDADTGLVPTDPLLPPLKDGDVLDLATKTITFANKSTQVLTDEQVKAYSAFKKVILCHGLGSVGDTVTLNEDGSGRVESKYKDINADSTQSWNTNAITTTHVQILLYVNDGLANGLAISDKIPLRGSISATKYVYIDVPKTSLGDLTGLSDAQIYTKAREYCMSLSGFIRYQLATPIVTTIPKEIMPTILTHNQTNILEVGGAVKPSSFKVTVPTTDGIKKEYTLTPINGWAGTAKANLLQTGDVGLVLDLTIPEQFNTLITNLPNELKPRAERTVLGYNGNTPVVVKISTDGTVKLPVTTTGVVKMDDTYKL